jgi:hypothetical protein
MKPSEHQIPETLRGKRIYLALEVDSESAEADVDAEALQEALVSLCRAVFSRGGTLALADSTPLLSLILIIATEYWDRDFDTMQPEETPRAPSVLLFNSGEEDEIGWWSQTGMLVAESSDAPLQRAVTRLIEQTRPRAMICLGGVGRVLEQARLFREYSPRHPIYTVAATGGDARRLPQATGAVAEDEQLMATLRSIRRETRFPEQREPSPPGEGPEEAAFIPYPLLMQRLVDRIARGT